MIQKSADNFFFFFFLFFLFFYSLSEAIALQQVNTGFRCSKSQNNASTFPSLCTAMWYSKPTSQPQRKGLRHYVISKQAKKLLKDKKTKYLFSDVQDCCLPAKIPEMEHDVGDHRNYFSD